MNHVKNVVFHATDEKKLFTEFKCPAYFTNMPKFAAGFGSERLISVKLNIINPYIIDGEEEGRHFEWDSEDIQLFKNDGIDGVIIRHPDGDVYTVFDQEQITILNQNCLERKKELEFTNSF